MDNGRYMAECGGQYDRNGNKATFGKDDIWFQFMYEVDRLTQDEKMEIMDILNRKGVFLLKGSVSHVAQTLHSSEASIYRYLGKLNNK